MLGAECRGVYVGESPLVLKMWVSVWPFAACCGAAEGAAAGVDAGSFSAGPELSLLKLRVCLTPSRRQMEQFWKQGPEWLLFHPAQNPGSELQHHPLCISGSSVMCVCASLAAEWGIYIYLNSIKWRAPGPDCCEPLCHYGCLCYCCGEQLLWAGICAVL